MLNSTDIDITKNKFSSKYTVLIKKLSELSDFTKEDDRFFISNLAQNAKNDSNELSKLPNNLLCNSCIYYKSPLNVLFSIDQFFFEFAKKSPQRKKASEFKLQLKERKKLSLFYGSLSKKQLSQIVNESRFYKGHDSKKILSFLEQRLDVILYRSNFAKNIALARQYISHKKILVNNKYITIPSYRLNPGDIISIAPQNWTKIGSTMLENLTKNIPKRHSISLLETIILEKWARSNTIISKKDFEFFIGLLMKKIQSRADIIISQEPFYYSLNQKQFLEKNKCFCLFKFKPKQNTQTIVSEKDNKITPRISLVNIRNNIEFASARILPEGTQLDPVKRKNISESEYFQHELIRIILGFNYKKFSREFFVLILKKYLFKNPSKKQKLDTLKIGGVKPIHLEISYKLLKIIVLYSPQRIYYPFFIDVDLIKRSYKK
jgi:ribosomal protein S4